MRRRLTRLGVLGIALTAFIAMGASSAAAKRVTATYNQCTPAFAPIPEPNAAFPTQFPNNAAAVSVPVTVPKIKGKVQDGQVTQFTSAGVQINHTFVSDIVVNLVSPGGKVVSLSTNRGGNDNGFGSAGCAGLVLFGDAFTTFIGAAGNPASSDLPVTGAFRPEGLLSSFVGGPARGNWTLIANDVSPADAGAIAAVSLNFTYTYNKKKKKKK